MHETTEFSLPRHRSIFEILKDKFDPHGLAHASNDFYTAASLLKREGVRSMRKLRLQLTSLLLILPKKIKKRK